MNFVIESEDSEQSDYSLVSQRWIIKLLQENIIVAQQTSHGVYGDKFGYALFIQCSGMFYNGVDIEPLDYDAMVSLYNMAENVKRNEWYDCIKDIVEKRRSESIQVKS